jgi:hypothetical protein
MNKLNFSTCQIISDPIIRLSFLLQRFTILRIKMFKVVAGFKTDL